MTGTYTYRNLDEDFLKSIFPESTETKLDIVRDFAINGARTGIGVGAIAGGLMGYAGSILGGGGIGLSIGLALTTAAAITGVPAIATAALFATVGLAAGYFLKGIAVSTLGVAGTAIGGAIGFTAGGAVGGVCALYKAGEDVAESLARSMSPAPSPT